MRLKHVLVPTDFGPASRRAEDFAAMLATQLDAKLTLLHVWSVPTPAYAEMVVWPVEDIEKAAKDALDEALARLRAQHVSTEAVLRMGLTWRSILDVAKDRDVDMIVMGTHGRRGLPRVLLGSVAEKIVRLSTVPVVTVGNEGR